MNTQNRNNPWARGADCLEKWLNSSEYTAASYSPIEIPVAEEREAAYVPNEGTLP
jgi:hypothetical protein